MLPYDAREWAAALLVVKRGLLSWSGRDGLRTLREVAASPTLLMVLRPLGRCGPARVNRNEC